MANYRINEDAKADLQRIYRRGVLEFGEDRLQTPIAQCSTVVLDIPSVPNASI